jgi:hypothetical protein
MNRQTTPCRRRRKQPRRYFKDGLWHDERKPDSEVAMMLRVARKPVEIFFAAFILATFAHAQCPVNSIVIKGHVEHLPRNASVGVQLLFAPDPHAGKRGSDLPDIAQRGESAEAILDGAAFSIPVEFVTNNRRPLMSFGSRCDRRPQTVVVTLKGNAAPNEDTREYDSVSLDFPDAFKIDDGKDGGAKPGAASTDDYKLNDSKSSDARRYTPRSDLVLDGEGR